MKKLLAIILALTFVLSLSACGKFDIPKIITDKNKETSSEELSSKTDDELEFESAKEIYETTETENTINTSSEIYFEDVTNFDEFIETMDNKGYKPTIQQNNDGSTTIQLNTPTTDNETIKPAIPTIENIPEPTPQPVPTPQPEENDNIQPEENEETDTNSEETTPEEEPTPTVPEIEEEPAYTYTSNQTHTKLHYTNRYLYSVLDEEKKGWYRAIDDAVTNLQASAELNCTETLSENRNYYIYFLYMFDNPEHFYLGNTVTIYGSDKLIFCYSDGEMTCRFGSELKEINDELRARVAAKKAVFETEVNRILSTIPSDAPDVWKEKLIYDRILTDSHYNLGAQWDGIANDNWTAYGILVNKYGVCESYAEAFQTLCLYVGINCTGVVGTAGGGHKWNCVQLDGEWYMCDITFDDPIGGGAGAAYHFYFNLTSQTMSEFMHDWSNSQWPVPNCTATKYSYSNYFGN